MKPEDALDRLDYVRDLMDRTRYRAAHWWSYLTAWGVVWAAGWLAQYALGTPAVWWVALPAGAAFNAIVGYRQRHAAYASTPLTQKIFQMDMVLFGAALVLSVVLVPSFTTPGVYWPVALGLVYAVNGVFLGWGLVVTGIWLAGVGVASAFMSEQLAALWLAGAAGGGLVASGLLLRRQLPRPAKTP